MKRVKVRTDSGVVCELVFYNVSDRADVKKAKPPHLPVQYPHLQQ